MVASLVVFLPGAALTTAVLELAAGQMISGSSRLVSGGVQLALLAFGILAGIEAVGVPSSQVLVRHRATARRLGAVARRARVRRRRDTWRTRRRPGRSSGLLVVLYAAWSGQVLGNAVLGGYVSALVGAAVMTPVAFLVSRLPSAMPAHASFLPGFWLLVPGALGLIGLTQLAGDGDGAGRTARRHRRLDLRRRPRRALRHAAAGVGRRHRSGRRRGLRIDGRTESKATAPANTTWP